MKTENIKEAAQYMQKALELLARGPLDYYFSEMAGAHDFMMARFCPFQPGDRVELAITPEINERDSPGWLGGRHFLIEGAPATVESAECGSKGFLFGVIFDNETWIDLSGAARPVDRKGAYYFRETSLRKLSVETPEQPHSPALRMGGHGEPNDATASQP